MNEPVKKAGLFLLPNLLGDQKFHEPYLPNSVDKLVKSLDGLICESEKEGRRYLSRFNLEKAVRDIPIALFNEHTKDEDLDFLLEPVVKGERWGLITDAGLPCIADPGAKLVKRAKQRGTPVQAFVGPCSFILALMLSGLPGQKFAFQGYLDKDEQKRKKQIVSLEKRSKDEGCTQIFMEAPYRSHHMLQTLLEALDPQTELCIAWDLTLPTQGVVTQSIKTWRNFPAPNLEKKNAVFLISS